MTTALVILFCLTLYLLISGSEGNDWLWGDNEADRLFVDGGCEGYVLTDGNKYRRAA